MYLIFIYIFTLILFLFLFLKVKKPYFVCEIVFIKIKQTAPKILMKDWMNNTVILKSKVLTYHGSISCISLNFLIFVTVYYLL